VLAGGIVAIYLALLWLTSILWVVRDIRSRTSDIASQVTAVVIAGGLPFVGLPIYMVLRPAETLQTAYDRQLEEEAILTELHSISACPSCRRAVDDDYMVCPHCATELRQPCRQCQRPLANAWDTCPYCATVRRVAAPQGAVTTPEPRLQMTEPPPIELKPAEAVAKDGPTSIIERAELASDDEDEPDEAASERRRESSTSVIDRGGLADADADAEELAGDVEPPARLRTGAASSGEEAVGR
jgi:RNA polymerase subunit RPABC4/transcription elongation factor Spt4